MFHRLNVDLQWFARMPLFDADSGAPAGGGDSGTHTGEPAQAPVQGNDPQPGGTAPRMGLGRPGMVNPILAAAQGGVEPSGQEPANAPPAGNEPVTGEPQGDGEPGEGQSTQPGGQGEPELLDFGGRKVPVVDPVIKELHQDWQNLNRVYQQANQKALTVEQQNQLLMQMVQNIQQQSAATQQQPAQPQGPSEEEIKAFNEKVLEKFYEDPIAAQKMLLDNPLIKSELERKVEEMVKAKVDPVLSPIQKQQQFQADYQQTVQKYPDFNEFVPQMQEVLQQYPDMKGQSLEKLYLFTKGLIATQTPPAKPPTLEELLANPETQKAIAEHPQIKQTIINSYLQSVQQQQTQQPNLMGSQPGGVAPQINRNRPTTIKEAGQAHRQYLFGGGG